jgi:hypothetical protein
MMPGEAKGDQAPSIAAIDAAENTLPLALR